jgi:phage terminase large subunit-like protein
MSASVFHRVPLFVSDHQALLAGDAQAVREPMAPGSTGIAGASGVAVRPYQAGCRLEVHVRACRCVARRRYRHDPGLVPNPGQNPRVMNA